MVVKGNREIDNASAPALKQAEVEQCGGSERRGISIWVCDNVMAPCKVKKKKKKCTLVKHGLTDIAKINRFGGNLDNAITLKGAKERKNWIFFLHKNGD